MVLSRTSYQVETQISAVLTESVVIQLTPYPDSERAFSYTCCTANGTRLWLIVIELVRKVDERSQILEHSSESTIDDDRKNSHRVPEQVWKGDCGTNSNSYEVDIVQLAHQLR
jgi:hypothetical protein